MPSGKESNRYRTSHQTGRISEDIHMRYLDTHLFVRESKSMDIFELYNFCFPIVQGYTNGCRPGLWVNHTGGC